MILNIIRILIGLLFVLSGSLKMTDLISFHDTIELFNIFPNSYTNFFTIIIPSTEVVCGFSLFSNLFKKGSSLILMALISIFILAISINLIRGEYINCYCFGPIKIFNNISFYSILFNLLIIAILLYIFFSKKTEIKIMDNCIVLYYIGNVLNFL